MRLTVRTVLLVAEHLQRRHKPVPPTRPGNQVHFPQALVTMSLHSGLWHIVMGYTVRDPSREAAASFFRAREAKEEWRRIVARGWQ